MSNVALNKTAEASSSVAPFLPSRAVNGQTAPLQRWVCDVLPAYLTINLGEYYRINSVVLKFMETAGWDNRYNIKGYAVKASTDKLNWDTWYSDSGNTASTVTIPLSSRPAQWVKMEVNPGWGLNINPNAASLVEMEVYESNIDPYLSNLTISSGTLSPAFNKKTFSYDVTVDSSTPTITVTPTADDSAGASITVNNQTVHSGSPSQTIQLNPGLTTITVTVSNQGIQQSYIIKVNQESPTVAYLTGLTVKDPRNQVIPLSPTFQSTTLSYSGTANCSSVTVIPTSPGNTILVNNVPVSSGSPSVPIVLNVGPTPNRIVVKVTPGAGGSTTTYNIDLTRNS